LTGQLPLLRCHLPLLLLLLKGEFTLHVSLSEISLKLPLSPNHSPLHLFYQFWKKNFCDVFYELELSQGFPCCLWHTKQQSNTVRIDWYFRTACCEWNIVIHCAWSWASAVIKWRQTSSQMSQKLVAQAFPSDSLVYAIIRLAGSWTVTETTNMEELYGTNLKPISQTCFF
jgi:hypothetical protein